MKKGIQFLLGLAIIGLVYVVANLIYTPLSFEQQLDERNAAVTVKLKDIRAAERAFKSKYQYFTGDFDSLINFILTDSLTMERKLVDEDDSVAMAQLKKAGKKNIEQYNIAVVDTIFNPRKLSKQEIQDLRWIPYTDNKVEFILEAAKVMTGANVLVPVVECRAPYKLYLDTVAYRQNIINLIDDRVNNFNAYAGLKFGSMEGSNNEAGNWE
ncbi:MAG: hypothetical protein IKK27_05030 [Alistipes sp.]|nr:hypothetical protein [Alistipes sp.]MBR7115448.1 hypothetical protein [Alistipes sp.]MDO5488150.1 hypothetical protein [Rikenellaceae bacterium]